MPLRDARADAPSPSQDLSPLSACTGPGLLHPRTMMHRGVAAGLWEQRPHHAGPDQNFQPILGTRASAPGNDPGSLHHALDVALRAAAGEDHLGAATALLSGAVLSIVLWVAAIQVVLSLR